MNIMFIYYFKKNHKVHKAKLNYFTLLNLLELSNKKDKRGVSYKKAITPQLMELQQTLLKIKELNIFKCNVFLNDKIIL